MVSSPTLVVAVIGGGAAGLTAAISARYKGAMVKILERMDRVGKKILATGNGRCNLSNTSLDIANYYGTNPKFASAVLKQFNFEKTIDFFDKLGITCKVEEEGKVFPVSEQASSVLDVLRHELETIGVEIKCESEVKNITGRKGNFTLHLSDGGKVNANRVIIATGGKAASSLGSNGSGYVLAEKLGHRIVDPFPSLVQLRLRAPYLKHIKGIKFIGKAEVLIEGKSLVSAEGEILFTDYGISGPPIFSLSRTVGELLRMGNKVMLKVCLVNDKSREQLEAYISDRLRKQSHKTLAFSFVGYINKRLVPVLLREAGIEDVNRPSAQVTAKERYNIVSILQDWQFEVIGTNPWQSAQVTAGGVDVGDIKQETLESKLVAGLYFAGEIIDIDGACGGYNLQWAWSSGFVAGESAASS